MFTTCREHPIFDPGPRPTVKLAHRRADELRRRAGMEVCRDGGALARTVFATPPSPTDIDLSAAAAVDESVSAIRDGGGAVYFLSLFQRAFL